MKKLSQYWKAVVGFIVPGATMIGVAVQDSSVGGSSITTAEWVTAIVACVVTSGGVAAVKNQPKA
jgi:hypothetical protein